jgi:hypothetical protein
MGSRPIPFATSASVRLENAFVQQSRTFNLRPFPLTSKPAPKMLRYPSRQPSRPLACHLNPTEHWVFLCMGSEN